MFLSCKGDRHMGKKAEKDGTLDRLAAARFTISRGGPHLSRFLGVSFPSANARTEVARSRRLKPAKLNPRVRGDVFQMDSGTLVVLFWRSGGQWRRWLLARNAAELFPTFVAGRRASISNV